jgi:hypothetical protein
MTGIGRFKSENDRGRTFLVTQSQQYPRRETHGRNLLDFSLQRWTTPGVPISQRIHVDGAITHGPSHMGHIAWSGTLKPSSSGRRRAPTGTIASTIAYHIDTRLCSHMDSDRCELGQRWKLSHAQKARRRHRCAVDTILQPVTRDMCRLVMSGSVAEAVCD